MTAAPSSVTTGRGYVPPSASLHTDDAQREAFERAFAERPDDFTPAERQAVEAVFFERRSMRDAASVVGVTFSALRTLVYAAQRTLLRGRAPRKKGVAFRGETKPLTHWAREYGLNVETVRTRLYLGWSLERALGAKVAPEPPASVSAGNE